MAFWFPESWRWVFGYLAFRSRIRGVYFSILTQALTYGACLLFFRNSLLMGGNNGFTDFKFMLGYDLRFAATQRGLLHRQRRRAAVGLLGCRWLSRTKFGLVQQAIRDSENRVLFSGYAAANYKLFVFVVARADRGARRRALRAQVGIINPSEMHAGQVAGGRGLGGPGRPRHL